LKARVAALAKKTGCSAHHLILEAIERHADREEAIEAFVKEALAAEADIDKTGEVYRAEDVHAWIDRIARGEKHCYLHINRWPSASNAVDW
jgi:predicted transcriptional regulator